MTATPDFSPKPQTDEETFTFDFSRMLPDGVSITGTPSFTVTVLEGVDANPSAMISVSGPSIVGPKVLKKFRNGVIGVYYRFKCSVVTSDAQTLSISNNVRVVEA